MTMIHVKLAVRELSRSAITIYSLHKNGRF